ncbi:MAG TPA: recombinase family protein [Myxococcota bacterium]|nr:recombinase family protein [Myxococcota bacterium]
MRSIFSRYLEGEGLKQLAHSLNASRIAPPRPRANRERRASWSPSAIRVILLNPVYCGEVVWNRTLWIKDHESGKRRCFDRPAEEWIRREAPELAIVELAVSEAVRAELSRRGGIRASSPPRRNLLSGLLVCASCGGNFVGVTGDFYACSWRRSRGEAVCATKLLVRKDELEGRILSALADHVLDPANVRYAVDRALRRVCAGLRHAEASPRPRPARLAEIEEELAVLSRMSAGDCEAARSRGQHRRRARAGAGGAGARERCGAARPDSRRPRPALANSLGRSSPGVWA